MGAQAQRKVDTGAEFGAGIDWGDGVGKLTVGQCRAVALAVETGLALAATWPGAGSAASPSSKEFSAVLSSTSPAVAPFLDALIDAMAALTSRNVQWLRDLPLDVFIDGVVAVFSALMSENTDYLAGPVSLSLQQLSVVIQALSPSRQQAR